MEFPSSDQITEWLAEHAAYPIRLQVAGIIRDDHLALTSRQGLLADTGIRQLLDRLSFASNFVSIQTIHGCKTTHLENILPMLLDRGLDVSFPEMKNILEKIAVEVHRLTDQPDNNYFPTFIPIILIPFLLWSGYRDNWITAYFENRLALVSKFCRKMEFDIFGRQDQYKGIPTAFAGRNVIRPELYEEGKFQFPLIYDLYAYRAMFHELPPSRQEQINHVLAYIMSNQYQRFPLGYGLLQSAKHNYHAMGWDAILPVCPPDSLSSAALHRMELLAPFPVVRQTRWFRDTFKVIMHYKLADGRFRFPKEVLPEKEGYWVNAKHMSLGENRRKPEWIAIEGTFRVLRLFSWLSRKQ